MGAWAARVAGAAGTGAHTNLFAAAAAAAGGGGGCIDAGSWVVH